MCERGRAKLMPWMSSGVLNPSNRSSPCARLMSVEWLLRPGWLQRRRGTNVNARWELATDLELLIYFWTIWQLISLFAGVKASWRQWIIECSIYWLAQSESSIDLILMKSMKWILWKISFNSVIILQLLTWIEFEYVFNVDHYFPNFISILILVHF